MAHAEFVAAAGLSEAAAARLARFDALLLARGAQMNLIARSTIADRWRRHYLDSSQLFALLPPGCRTLVDLGSGAGFPGLVIAAMGAEAGLEVILVESVKKKAAFLVEAAAAMELASVRVFPERIEALRLPAPDAIVARALAPLPRLLAYAAQIAGRETVCLFLKGQDVGAELTEASRYWQMQVERRPSATSPASAVLIIRGLRPAAPRGQIG